MIINQELISLDKFKFYYDQNDNQQAINLFIQKDNILKLFHLNQIKYIIINKYIEIIYMAKGGHGRHGSHGGFIHSGFRNSGSNRGIGHGSSRNRAITNHRRGGRNFGNQNVFNAISNSNTAPMTLNGVYCLKGNQINVVLHLQNFEMYMQQYITLNLQPFNQADLTIVGIKTQETNKGCIIATMLGATCCIIPGCFMCCGWWKKIVYAKYEINTETYRSLSRILNNPMSPVTNLNLTVVDNAFNFEKARILYQMLSTSRLTGFTFTNQALACNYNASEADDFLANMAPFRSLPFPCVCTWDDLILV